MDPYCTGRCPWVPACAGTTIESLVQSPRLSSRKRGMRGDDRTMDHGERHFTTILPSTPVRSVPAFLMYAITSPATGGASASLRICGASRNML